MMEHNMIELPQLKQLKDEVEQLRNMISEKLMERDHLVLQVCKNIESAYLLLFGPLEYKVYEAECLHNRTKRKLELIIAKRNRQEKADLNQIEALLDAEFEVYQRQLDERIKQMNKALERGELMSAEETREMKKLYREIVKKLHPDLHPDLSDSKRELFRKTVEAYERGDLATIRLIGEMICNDLPDIQCNKNDTLRFYLQEKTRMRKMVDSLNEAIDKIKHEFPYLLSVYLEDETEAEKQRVYLENRYEFYKAGIQKYETEIAFYMGVTADE